MSINLPKTISVYSSALVGNSFMVVSWTNFKSINWSDAEINDLVHGY